MPYFFSASPHVGFQRAQKKQKRRHGEHRFHVFASGANAGRSYLKVIKVPPIGVSWMPEVSYTSAPDPSSPAISLFIYPFSRFASKSIDGIVKKKQDS